MLLLTLGNRGIEMVKISEGGVSGTVIDPKKIFKIALEKNASSILPGIIILQATLNQVKLTKN